MSSTHLLNCPAAMLDSNLRYSTVSGETYRPTDKSATTVDVKHTDVHDVLTVIFISVQGWPSKEVTIFDQFHDIHDVSSVVKD